MQTSTKFNELAWESKEFDWTGKTFYFIPIINVFGHPFGLGNKLFQLNRDCRQAGCKTLSGIILIQYKLFGGRLMIEIEKPDQYDAQVITFEDTTTVDTVVHKGSAASIGRTAARLKQRVSSRRSMEPRAIYYWLVNGIGSERAVVFSVT